LEPQVVGFRWPKQVSGLASRQVLHPARQAYLLEQPFQTRQPQSMALLLLRLVLLVLGQRKQALPLQISRQELLSFRRQYQRTR
jgi:hypothetical protein